MRQHPTGEEEATRSTEWLSRTETPVPVAVCAEDEMCYGIYILELRYFITDSMPSFQDRKCEKNSKAFVFTASL